jgi:pimeloyl-CoA dehydrogenase
MNFALDDDHLALREAVQRFCDAEFPARERGNPETMARSAHSRTALAGLGLMGLPFAEDLGGSGLGAIEVMLVAQELGRALGGGVFVASTVLAGSLLQQLASTAQQQTWLPALAAGRTQAAVAVFEGGHRDGWRAGSTAAVATPQGWLLNGRKTLVLHGDSADHLLVLARTSGAPGDAAGLSVLVVDAHTPGVQVQGFETLDGRRAAHIRFEGVVVPPDRLLGQAGAAADAVDAALDAATAALCAEAVGAVDALLVMTAEHLRTRRQFGAPLAKFQVLQHRVADMAIDLEQLKSMACAAAMAVQGGGAAQRRRLVSAAKVLVSQKGRAIGLAAIQLHGAMGMTDECRVGHYAKRLIVIGQLLGDAAWHLRRMQTPFVH